MEIYKILYRNYLSNESGFFEDFLLDNKLIRVYFTNFEICNYSRFTKCVRCYIINTELITKEISSEEIKNRYLLNTEDDSNNMSNSIYEKVLDEEQSYSDDSLYNITSFGTDLSLREIAMMYEEGELEKPELQRKYVWSKNEASRFIDSVLLGLPVPSIFLAKTADEKRLIVDGYQRIMTVCDFMKGIFGGDGKVFKLSNSENINVKWRGKTFVELSDEHKRKIKNYPIHAIIFEQKHPQNDTGMYQIFERINTSGRPLKPQEIRNCVYHGNFNGLLFELNKYEIWRNILGFKKEDSRMADVELILRFFAFIDLSNRVDVEQSQINLVKFMNEYMKDNCNINKNKLDEFSDLFKQIMQYLYRELDAITFKNAKFKDQHLVWAKRINPVIYDAVSVATYQVYREHGLEYLKSCNIKEKYMSLVQDEDFALVISQRTTNVDNIKRRVAIAKRYLFEE